MKSAILLQGPATFDSDLLNFYSQDILFSTWVGEKSSIKNTIYINKPNTCGIGNSNLQFCGCLAGCNYAESLGYDYVLKIRSDILLQDYDHIIKLLDKNKLSFLFYHNWSGGYLADYMIGGPIELLQKVWNYDTSLDNNFSERILMNQIKKLKITSVNYIMPMLIQNNIKCYSLKWRKDLTESFRIDDLAIYPEFI